MTFRGEDNRPEWECADCGGTDCQLCQAEWLEQQFIVDAEMIERGLRTIQTYDAVELLRDALIATTARLTGYDWNVDPDAVTKQQGDALEAANKVFSDLDAAVAAHPDIDLPECDACNGTGKIEEPARTEGANQHSACVRSCDECDGCGFAA